MLLRLRRKKRLEHCLFCLARVIWVETREEISKIKKHALEHRLSARRNPSRIVVETHMPPVQIIVLHPILCKSMDLCADKLNNLWVGASLVGYMAKPRHDKHWGEAERAR